MLALRVRQGLGDVVLGSNRVLDVLATSLADDAPELLGLRALDGVADGGPALLRYRLVRVPINEGLLGRILVLRASSTNVRRPCCHSKWRCLTFSCLYFFLVWWWRQ